MNLKEFSSLLNLSPTTVSRALNGYPEVSEKTRARVQAMAEAHNYRPNTRAQALATGRAMAIGHVLPQGSKHEMVNPIFGDFIAGAGEMYSKHHYDMILSMVPDVEEEKAYRDMRAKGNVDGLILHGPKVNDPRIALVKNLGLPFVVHGRSSAVTEPYPWVDVNNRRAFARAVDLLLDLGHRKIALLNGPEDMDFATRRQGGFVSSLTARGVAPDPDLMFANEMTEVYGYNVACDVLARDDAPTAFVTSSFVTALGVRRAIEERGLKLGRDVSVVTHDDDLSYLPNGGDVPMFTATKSSVREAGRRAAQMLINIIDGQETPEPELLEAQLVIGQSTGPVNLH